MSWSRITAIGIARPAALIAAGLLLASCGPSSSSSSAPSGGSSSSAPGTGHSSASHGSGGIDTTLFPASVGNTWVYEDSLAGGQSGTTTNRITAVTPDSGGQKVTISTSSDVAGLPHTATNLTYQFNSDGSIQVPYANIGNGTVILKSGGIVWPSKAVLDSGQPHTSVLSLEIKAAGHDVDVHANVTVKGGGTQSVTVPAGTYQATAVDETISEHVAGVDVVIQITTWLANGVGPVKSVVMTKTSSVSQIVSTEVLKSFKQG